MTLPDLDEREEEISNNNAHQQTVVMGAVVDVVKQAAEEGRVVCDLLTCVQLLGSFPEEVMMCILAQPTAASQTQSQDEIVVGIQHTLIRAFCQECFIDLLYVQDQVKLTKLLLTSLSQAQKGPWQQHVVKAPMAVNSSGYSCILIKYPKNGNSHDDDVVAEYIKHEKAINKEPFMALPSFE